VISFCEPPLRHLASGMPMKFGKVTNRSFKKNLTKSLTVLDEIVWICLDFVANRKCLTGIGSPGEVPEKKPRSLPTAASLSDWKQLRDAG
jgi:hypothetical protein